MKKIKVLHLFKNYLPTTLNWAYHLLRHTPEVEIHIAARHYLKENFFDPQFFFIDNYTDGLEKYNYGLGKKTPRDLIQKIVIKIVPFFIGTHQKYLLNYIRSHSIDLIHAHFAPTAWEYRALVQKAKIPFVVSFYGYDYENLPYRQPVFTKRYRWLFQHVDHFICEGVHGAEILKRIGCPQIKIRVQHLGVEIKNIPFFRRVKQAGELNLIQVASFTEKKGHIYSVQAFAQALKTCPNMHLTLVGNEKEPGRKEQIVRYINKHQLAQKIDVLRPIPYSELYHYLQRFQVFIHPSCYTNQLDCEGGAPVVLLDAQATGLPIISTNHCDIPGVIFQNKTGLLAEEKDVQGLAKAIETFYWMGNEEFQSYSRESRTFIEQHFNIEKNAAHLNELYSSFIRS